MREHLAEYDDWLPAYALGALEGNEEAELERHLRAGCAACSREITATRDVLALLPLALPLAVPSETTRKRILRVGRKGVPGRSVSWPAALTAAAALALVLWSGLAQISLRRQLAAQRRIAESHVQELAATRAARDQAQARTARLAAAVRWLAAPASRPIVLAGLEAAPGARGRAYLDEGGRALFVADGLTPAGQARTYQLWFIRGGAPVAAGVFDADSSGFALLELPGVEEPAAIQAWAVTIEPKGGVAAPTGPMVLKS